MPEENTNTKIFYFIDYWRDFLYVDSIEKELSNPIINNPRELFQEFANEIRLNGFNSKNKNSDRYKLFINCVKEFYKLEIECTSFLKPTIKLIEQQFNDTDESYLLYLLQIVQQLLTAHNFGSKCIEELVSIICDDSELNQQNKEKIKVLTRLTMYELVHKKYSYKSIKNFINDIFDDYKINRDGILSTKFPHNYTVDYNTTVDSPEFKEYQERIINLIGGLTVKDRLLSLRNFFNKKPQKLIYIFQIKGLKGDINMELGNVRIYNPKQKKLIKNRNLGISPFDEFFEDQKLVFCNAAVTLDLVDSEYASQEANQIISEVLDVLASAYINYKIPLEINTSKMLICDEDGNQRGSNSTNESLSHHKSIDIGKYENLEYLSEFYNSKVTNSQLIVDKKILESLHYRRRAIESLKLNEKILWHWVSVENIVGKPAKIFDIVPKLLVVNNLYEFIKKHLYKLYELNRFYNKGYFRDAIILPLELKEKIGLNEKSGTRSLKSFVDTIPEIIAHIDNQSLLFEQLSHLHDMFNQPTKCLALINKIENISRQKLVYINRLRNKVVHDANKESSPSDINYLDFMNLVSSDVLFEFIKKRNDMSLENIDSILNDIKYNFDRLEIEIMENGTQILFK